MDAKDFTNYIRKYVDKNKPGAWTGRMGDRLWHIGNEIAKKKRNKEKIDSSEIIDQISSELGRARIYGFKKSVEAKELARKLER